MLFFAPVLSLLLFSSVEPQPHILNEALRQKVYEQPAWLKLLHYQKKPTASGTFEWTSRIDGEAFFLSPIGRHSPRSELIESIILFKDESPEAKIMQCRFPARRQVLMRLLKISFEDPVNCPHYQKFKSDLDAQSVSIVFSSYYLNNPSSAFGHTLFRFNKNKSTELLDYAVNFSADVDTQNAVTYAFKGMFGLFRGTFKVMPYYLMVRKYNSFEARDLWSYELNLTGQEVELLVAHLWELGSTHMDYFYLSENCSFALLATIEAIAPQFDFVDRMSAIVIPVDTIRIANETPGLIKQTTYRPSEREKFYHRWENLSESDKNIVTKIVRDPDLLDASDSPPSVEVLDTLIDYYDYKFPKEIHRRDKSEFQIKKKVLLARSQMDEVSTDIRIPPAKQHRPEAGHKTSRFGLGYLYDSELSNGISLQLRSALHDLNDPRESYPDYAQIEFFSLKSSVFFIGPRLIVEHLDLVRIYSLMPTTFLDQQLSWSARLGAETIRQKNCDRCLAGHGGISLGFTKSIYPPNKLDVFYLLHAQIEGHPELSRSGVVMSSGPQVGVRAELVKNLNLLSRFKYLYSPLAKDAESVELEANLRWAVSKNRAADFNFYKTGNYWSSGANFKFYF